MTTNNPHPLMGCALQRAITPEQINQNRGHGPLRRTASVAHIDTEARTVEVAFSSETPVPRWFGDEVLDHSENAMVSNRLDNGAAVLWNHDQDIQIGVVESAEIGADRVGRAVLRFGRSPRAEEIWADVADGVIRHVSVGYFVRLARTEERENAPDKVTITKWEPFEISLVSVPADASVGVGRSAGEPPEDAQEDRGDSKNRSVVQNEGTHNMTRILRHNGALVRAEVDGNGQVIKVLEVLESAEDTNALLQQNTQEEQQRTATLLQLGEQYSAQSQAADAIRNNTSVDEFTRSLLDHVNTRSAPSDPLSDNGGQVGLTDAEVQRFSFMRALRALANPTDTRLREEAAFEFEASNAAAQAMGRDAQGIMVPMDVLTRALNTGTDGLSPGNTGGLAVGTTLLAQSFIEMLRKRSIFLQRATPLGGLVGNFSIPGQAGGASGYWIDEDEDAREGTQDFRNVDLSPKTVGAYSEITRRMIMQSSVDAEAMVRRDLALALALTVDHAGFYGDGDKKPRGIKNLQGVNAVAFDDLHPSYQELINMESEISTDNADVASMIYVGNAKFRGHCKSTEKFKGSNGQPIWEKGNQVNGYDAEITNQIELGDVFHGNFADAVVGAWGGLDLTIDPYTHSTKGRLRIVAFQDVDIAFRNVESFAYGARP